jgi:undecaprenyl-diphosphatase
LSIAQAILLGLIQGLSEFLPISSTAHLTLAGRAMDLIDPARPESWTAFIAVIQIGTLVAVLAYFARDIVAITRAFLDATRRRIPFREQSLEARSALLIVLGTVPIVVVGLLFKDQIEGMFTKNLIVIGLSLVVLAILLEVAERVARFDRPIEEVRVRDALFIGAAQAVALIPGSSRSGTTITAGLFAGLTREAAARFSFLLSIPAVAASGLLELLHALEFFDSAQLVSLVVATVVSAISGYAAIAFLLRYLRSHTTRLFVVYRFIIGGGILAAIALEWLEP